MVKVRTFIYGSCVSRDTFEYLTPGRYELIGYSARQSLISAMSPPEESPLELPPIESAFQERMLREDWESSLPQRLAEVADSCDLLLWDLCDERLGVYQTSRNRDGHGQDTYATRSVESIRAGVDAHLQKYPLLPFGSVKHRLVFNRSIARYADLLQELDLHRKVILIMPPWATVTEEGVPVPSSFGVTPVRANRLFDAYHSVVKRLTGYPSISLPPSLARADSAHRWGPAPFHYGDPAYESMARHIEELTMSGGDR